MDDSLKHAFFYPSQNHDRVYNTSSMEHWLKKFFTSGVFTGELQVTANNDMTITLSGGYSNVDGKVKFFQTEQEMLLETAHATYDRIDSIVIERNDSERDIFAKVVTGGYSSNPVALVPIRENGIYQLVVAQIRVSHGAVRITQADITDTRADPRLCGIVAGTVKEIDFNQIQTQFDSYFNNYKSDIKEKYSEFVAETDGSYNQFVQMIETYIEGLQASGDSQLDEVIKSMVDYEQVSEEQWQEWFDGIRQTLASAENGEMLEQILKLLNDLYDVATSDDIDAIIDGTYKEDGDNESAIFEPCTDDDIDAIINGSYVDLGNEQEGI